MKKIVTFLLLIAILVSVPLPLFAGDRFGRNFERAFGTALGIGAAIIVTEIVDKAINPCYYKNSYYEPPYVLYNESEYYENHDRHRWEGYYSGYNDDFNDSFADSYDEGYYPGFRKY